MARQGQTTTFELLCGYLSKKPGFDNLKAQEEGEPHADYLERTHDLQQTCKLKELDHNIDRDLANRDIDAVELLSRHLISVGDITDPTVLRTQVAPHLMKGDYDYSLLKSRMLSLGETYEFKSACPGCNVEGDRELDLAEIVTVDMPNPYARQLTYTTHDGIECVFRHLYAYDVECLGDILEEQDDEIRQILGLRLVSIDGTTPHKELLKKGRLGKSGTKRPTPEQHVKEAVRLLAKYEINHREKEDIRRKLEKMVGLPKLIMIHRCKLCRRQWSGRVAMEPSFFMASSGV